MPPQVHHGGTMMSSSADAGRKKRLRPGRGHAGGAPGDDANQISILSAARYDESEESTSILDDQRHQMMMMNAAIASSFRTTERSDIPSRRTFILTAAVGLLGAVSAGMFIGFGLSSSGSEQEQSFHHLAEELALQMEAAWGDYETASRWLHQACAFQDISRSDFRDLYEYMTLGIEVESISWVPKILHEERISLEESARAFYAENAPDLDYGGIRELQLEDKQALGPEYGLIPRANESFYYPAHLVEPLETNGMLLEFDVNSLAHSRNILEQTLDSWQPIVSPPFRMFPGTSLTSSQNSVMLLHPGIPLSTHVDRVPQDVAMLVIDTRSIMKRLVSRVNYDSVALYLYECSEKAALDEHVFLIGVDLSIDPSNEDEYYLPEINMLELKESTDNLMQFEVVPLFPATNWTLAVVALDGEFESSSSSTITAGVFMFMACAFVAFWIWWDTQRNRKMQRIRRKFDADNASIKLESAQQHARAEQELNDYIAHEIRNPLAAAMSACSFVKSAVNESTTLRNKEAVQSVREDVDIIDSSLTFMNDLLRSMLDMHKAASKRIDVNMAPADLKQDILDPVAAMLYQRDSSFDVLVECPENLIISTDRLRMKQCVLNLGRNSTKFVEKGFIKLVASVVNGKVRVLIEDSGPGIPEGKRENLFNKFQESLDVMEQGTGMGLCLVKHMTQILGGDVWLDESYNSGVLDCPGTRFIIETNLPPMSVDECHEYFLRGEEDKMSASLRKSISELEEFDLNGVEDTSNPKTDLPESLSVLFVDDDMVLRKLFSRSIKKVVDSWTIKEAANGESALQIVKEETFDVIFLDQYMSSAEKTLLGTETARALRAQGIQSRICGLSANDMEDKFLAAGADFFLQKPFPCKPEELRKTLIQVVHTERPIPAQKALARFARRSGSNTSTTMDESTRSNGE